MKKAMAVTLLLVTCLGSAQADPGISYQSNNVTIEVDPTQQQQLEVLEDIREILDKQKAQDAAVKSDTEQPSLVDSMESYKGTSPAWMTRKR